MYVTIVALIFVYSTQIIATLITVHKDINELTIKHNRMTTICIRNEVFIETDLSISCVEIDIYGAHSEGINRIP